MVRGGVFVFLVWGSELNFGVWLCTWLRFSGVHRRLELGNSRRTATTVCEEVFAYAWERFESTLKTDLYVQGGIGVVGR
jgi:hypothetical protein